MIVSLGGRDHACDFQTDAGGLLPGSVRVFKLTTMGTRGEAVWLNEAARKTICAQIERELVWRAEPLFGGTK